MGRFIRASLTSAAELIQTKRDLGATQMAQAVARARRAAKGRPLQSGGVLTVADGRQMVQRRDDEALTKAKRMVEAAKQKFHNHRKRTIVEAAKAARNWYSTGRLKPAEIVDGSGVLKRSYT